MNIDRWAERFESLMAEMENDGFDPVNVLMNMARSYVEDCSEQDEEQSNAVIWTFEDGKDLVMALTPSESCSDMINQQLH